jgi:hypothetical protein
VKPRPLVQARQIRPAPPVGARNWGPADRSFRRTTRAASADSEVRPGPRPPTLRPYHLKTGEAGPEAPIHILPADSAWPHFALRQLYAAAPIGRFCTLAGGLHPRSVWAAAARSGVWQGDCLIGRGDRAATWMSCLICSRASWHLSMARLHFLMATGSTSTNWRARQSLASTGRDMQMYAD